MRFATLIDLGVQTDRDRDHDPLRLAGRDAAIGSMIDAANLPDEEALKRWVAERNRGSSDSQSSVGQRVSGWIQLAQSGLAAAGLFLGIAAMASALAFKGHTNVISLWTILIGFQIVLLGLWILAVLPSQWVLWGPGARGLQQGTRMLGRIPVQLFTQILRWLSPSFRRQIRSLTDELQGSAKLYTDLMRWLTVRATQSFALAFNLGMILAFLALSYGSDPTFGWRSTMLSGEQMHQIVQWISWPWSSFWPEAVPTLEQVTAVKYSSKENLQLTLDPEQRVRYLQVWASLWPFLLASFCFYGLLPRVVTLAISTWQIHRYLRTGWKKRLELQKLLSRLRRQRVVSQSDPAKLPSSLPGGEPVREAGGWAECGPVPVFQWAGIGWSEQQVRTHLRDAFAVDVAFCKQVGQFDPREDRKAVVALEASLPVDRVVLLVEGWESPDADYLDFVRQLREAVTPETQIAVVLVSPSEPSSAASSEVSQLDENERIWREFFARIADPTLSVNRLAGSSGGSST